MTPLKWWQSAVFYQIYPRSFADGNGDGIGDFPGITSKLDYLRALGVDAIWLSPNFPSPQADCGYDISDYTGIAPEYGSLDDFAAFLREAHARGIRVILDLVLNHSSVEHPWFRESRASRANPKRDWYIWRDGRDGGPPNNWVSVFGGSAWELDAATGQYYYHFHLKEQPDLNWRNPEVKQAIWDVARFWLDMGVDGFRLDAVFTIFERPDLPDHTATPSLADPLRLLMAMVGGEDLAPAAAQGSPHEPVQPRLDRQRAAAEFQALLRHQREQPGVHELMQELRALVNEYPGDRVLIGEADDVSYYGSGDDELHLAFNFPLMHTPRLTPAHIRANQAERLAALPPGAWPCNTLGNHDAPRVWSRYGDGANDAALARVHAALILTLRGTPFLYYGEEIGMTNLELTELHQIRDTAGLIQYRRLTEEFGLSHAQAAERAVRMTRDRCRTPMQWSDAPNGGFSPADVATWLPANPNYAQGVNVADQEGDPESLLSFYRRLIALRRVTPALLAGAYAPVDEQAETSYAFTRSTPDQTVLVALNFSALPQTLALSPTHPRARVLFSSAERPAQITDPVRLALAPFEVLIMELPAGVSAGHATPELELVITLRVEIAPALEVGEVGAGFRRVIPITGGSFEGPGIRGEVLPGGADWNLTRPDGVAEVWARYTLRTDDGVLIGVTNAGLIVPQPDGSLYARTSPQFEVAGERYAWLRGGTFIGTLLPEATGDAVLLQFFRVN